MKTLTREWLRAAHNDLDVIEEIIHREDLTHIVAFHAQQCVEKVFKTLLEEYEKELPKIHNLGTLYGLVEAYLDSETRRDINVPLLKRLDELYIDSRYPGEFGLLPNGKPTMEDARTFYRFAQDIHDSVSEMLQNPVSEHE